MPDALADEIASLVLQQYDKLPRKRKPAVRDNGVHEWVPLSAIVAQVDGSLKCLSQATGMKCLPATKVPLSLGTVLHDWHAEILAIRALNHFLLQECKAVASGGSSLFVRRRTTREPQDSPDHSPPFALNDTVTLHMYCSEAPCGDASMELTMAAQQDSSPWEVPPPLSADSAAPPSALLSGRAYFSRLGIVRRKPARSDASPTLSKSCSDKLAAKQCTSLLSSVSSLLIHPGNVYLSSVVLPASQFSAVGCERSFSASGRMESVACRTWDGGYSFKEFKVRTTDVEFRYSKGEVMVRSGVGKTSASNLAVAWNAGGLEEGLIGGVPQGRKQFDGKGASAVSRRQMWALALEVTRLEEGESRDICRQLAGESYRTIKDGGSLAERRLVKEDVQAEALKGWVRNTGDEHFTL